ncbi:MAG: hypothetical protein GY800_09080 [Planctomycetes bacterium]|nr:hypothetical protein [Planctomycetota bacterium]
MKQNFANIAANTAPAAAAGMTWGGWIPDDIGKIACLFSIIGMVIFWYKNLRDAQKSIEERKKIELENILLRQQIAQKEKD